MPSARPNQTTVTNIDTSKTRSDHGQRKHVRKCIGDRVKMGESVLILCEELNVIAAARVFGSVAYCYLLSVIEIKKC